MSFYSYTVQSGDTLSKIAEEFYGDANKWRVIAAANPDIIKNPDVIQIGWELTIPPEDWQPAQGGGGGSSTGSLRRGAKGAAVRALQQDLVALGYALDIDGDFGSGTDAAVRGVQQENGLTIDGIAGPATLETIAALLQGDEEDEDEEGEEEEEEGGEEEDE